MPARIIVHEIFKRYGVVEALRGVSFEVAAGEILGLLGVNGAGKTTTLECLAGLRQPDAGMLEVAGVDPRKDPRAARAKTGVVLAELSLPDQATPREALKLFAALRHDRRDPKELLGRVGLGEQADLRVQGLSQGQRQRLNLALAFLGEPEVMLLDEPSTGLDPQARHDLQQEILRMKQDGRAVLLATHLLDEAEMLCDRVAVIDRGRILAIGTPAELAQRTDQRQRVRIVTDRVVHAGAWTEAEGMEEVAIEGSVLKFATANAAQALEVMLPKLNAMKIAVRGLEVRPATLEESFLRLTQEAGAAGGRLESGGGGKPRMNKDKHR